MRSLVARTLGLVALSSFLVPGPDPLGGRAATTHSLRPAAFSTLRQVGLEEADARTKTAVVRALAGMEEPAERIDARVRFALPPALQHHGAAMQATPFNVLWHSARMAHEAGLAALEQREPARAIGYFSVARDEWARLRAMAYSLQRHDVVAATVVGQPVQADGHPTADELAVGQQTDTAALEYARRLPMRAGMEEPRIYRELKALRETLLKQFRRVNRVDDRIIVYVEPAVLRPSLATAALPVMFDGITRQFHELVPSGSMMTLHVLLYTDRAAFNAALKTARKNLRARVYPLEIHRASSRSSVPWQVCVTNPEQLEVAHLPLVVLWALGRSGHTVALSPAILPGSATLDDVFQRLRALDFFG